MPTLQLRKADEVPANRKTSRAIQEQQLLYENFIRQIDRDNVGELVLEPDEEVRPTKVRLRRAASRLGAVIEVWDADGNVYFKLSETPKRRGRPKKAP